MISPWTERWWRRYFSPLLGRPLFRERVDTLSWKTRLSISQDGYNVQLCNVGLQLLVCEIARPR
jgi:hypothetical protein